MVSYERGLYIHGVDMKKVYGIVSRSELKFRAYKLVPQNFDATEYFKNSISEFNISK